LHSMSPLRDAPVTSPPQVVTEDTDKNPVDQDEKSTISSIENPTPVRIPSVPISDSTASSSNTVTVLFPMSEIRAKSPMGVLKTAPINPVPPVQPPSVTVSATPTTDAQQESSSTQPTQSSNPPDETSSSSA